MRTIKSVSSVLAFTMILASHAVVSAQTEDTKD